MRRWERRDMGILLLWQAKNLQCLLSSTTNIRYQAGIYYKNITAGPISLIQAYVKINPTSEQLDTAKFRYQKILKTYV